MFYMKLAEIAIRFTITVPVEVTLIENGLHSQVTLENTKIDVT